MLTIEAGLKSRLCAFRIQLLGMGLLALSCEARDLARTDTSAERKATAGIEHSKEIERDPGEEAEAVLPPQNISGSYLVQCDTYETTLPTTSATRIFCSLQDTAGKKVSDAGIVWSIEPSPGTSNLLGQETLPATSKWHVEFLLRSDYFQQNDVGVIAAVGAPAVEVRLGKGRFNPASAGATLSLLDRTTALNHQPVTAATIGSGNPWNKIYQDPVSLLFVSNALHGDMPFINSEAVCAQLDSFSPMQGAWRLPRREDLTRLHRLRADLIAGFSDWFWSSETVSTDTTQAYYEVLYDGQIGATPKTDGSMAFFCVADQLQ